MSTRSVKESPKYQGSNEEIAYVLDTTNWGGYTSGASCRIEDQNGTDQTATNLSGSASESGGEITSPLVIDLINGRTYKLYFEWVYTGNTFEAYLEIKCEN